MAKKKRSKKTTRRVRVKGYTRKAPKRKRTRK